ncbi:hypothetical protein [Desulforapulum autotrophicum]|nr:hypothetical protein [Desulforapulum autotrophicum]
MPLIKNSALTFSAAVLLVIVQILGSSPAGANQGIGCYYIRYDIKSSNNRIVDSALVMVPADQEYRTSVFYPHRAGGGTTAVPGNSAEQSLARAQENALKKLLEQRGLKSVSSRSSVFSGKTAAMETVISYEGAFLPPIEVVEQNYSPRTESFNAVFLVRFSPIAFPDQWKWLEFKTRVKSIFQDIISLF